MRVRIKYVSAEHDKSGEVRYRFRAPWKRCVMKSRDPVSPEFAAEYAALLHNQAPPPMEEPAPATIRPVGGTIEWLLNHYMASTEWRTLKPTSRQQRSLDFKRFNGSVPDNGATPFGKRPAATLDARAARAIRDLLADRPAAANNRVKGLRTAWAWAVENDHVPTNPFIGIRRVRTDSEGWTPWTIVDVRKYLDRHKRGSTAYLAIMILLFTAFRRSDAVAFGPGHLTTIEGVRAYRINTQKTGQEVVAPLMPQLSDAIGASVTGTKTFLVTGYGKPFTPAGFGNWFRDRCDEAGLSGVSAHGVRKAAGALLAEHGCTPHEIMSILGHENERQGVIYTASAERWKLARSAFTKIAKVSTLFGVDDSCRPKGGHSGEKASDSEGDGGPGRDRTADLSGVNGMLSR
jgi:integrase